MSPRSIFITGCNRGIGLELVRQFLSSPSPPDHLFATYRSEAKSGELLELAQTSPTVHAIQLDVDDTASFPQVVDQVDKVLGESGLNLLINNSGLLPQNRDLQAVTPEDMVAAFRTNCVAPLFLARAFLPLLKRAADGQSGPLGVDRAAIIQMSTAVASIAENSGGGLYAYRCSKSALNMSMKSLSVDLVDSGVLVLAIHPGWVLTEMGGPNAQISTNTCCSTMLDTLAGLTEKDHGGFLRYNNTAIPW